VNPEDFLLWLALGSTAMAWVFAVRRLRSSRIRLSTRVPRYLVLSAAALILATLVMVYYFLAVRLDIEYVHSYTSDSTPWHYRLAGLWGGQKGTLLIWSAAGATALMLNDRVWRKKLAANEVPDPDSMRIVLAWILTVGLGVLLLFEALLLIGGTFDRTDAYLRSVRPHGTGLQPVLRTPFMIIHPPLQFIGYSFSMLLFAAGVTGVASGRREWADVALPWTRWSFLISTVGLGLGGLWAYYVLNFGGYWAWDPVETANLLAWFPLLLLVHSLLYYRKRAMFAAAAPIFAVLTLLADLFSTIATRTGLWISVHAFTDPTKNFAADPLVRLLNILETGEILRWLAGMFLVALFATIWAFVHWLEADERRRHDAPRPIVRLAFLAATVLLGAASILALLDVRFLLSALFEGSNLIGFGNAGLGLGLLVAAIGLVFASPGMGGADEPAKAKGDFWQDYVTTPRLVFLGVILLALAFLVTFLLQILSVNGYQRSVYDQRSPIVALPILLTMGVALAHPTLGRRRSVVLGVAAGLIGIALAAAVRAHWQVLLLAPALLWALVGACIKMFKVSDLGRILSPRLRLGGALLMTGGVLDMVYWANPPSRIPLGWTDLHPSAWLAPLGIVAGLGSVLSALGVLRQKTVRAHRWGGALSILGIGFGAGVLTGLAAWLLVEPRRSVFPDAAKATPIPACAASLKREIRKTGVYLMHVGIVLGLAGIALSTFEEGPEQEIAIARGHSADAHGYNFTLVDSVGGPLNPQQHILQYVTAYVEMRRDGKLLDRAPLTMWLALERRYGEKVTVERFATQDVYMRPVEFVTPERTFLAHEDDVGLVSGQVDAVTFTVRTLPGMHLVWAGLWIVAAGMLVSLAAGAYRFEASKPPAPAGAQEA
jgi:cytochrome c-type biogenesis protein CcmF